MKKLLLATAVAAALGAPATPVLAQDSPHSLTANLGFFSEYIFRGITQTAGKPALQGGFDYGHASGFYAGTWASNVSWPQDFGAYTRSSLEWDFYGGYKGTFGKSDFGFDVGTIYYYYPGRAGGVSNPTARDADTWEIYGALTWKFLGVKLSYNLDDYFGIRPNGQKTDGTWYLDIYGSYAFGDSGWSLNAHYGILDVKNDGNEAAGTKASYDDWRIGGAYTVPAGLFKSFEVGAYYTDTSAKKAFYTDLTGYDTSKGALVAYVKKTF